MPNTEGPLSKQKQPNVDAFGCFFVRYHGLQSVNVNFTHGLKSTIPLLNDQFPLSQHFSIACYVEKIQAV